MKKKNLYKYIAFAYLIMFSIKTIVLADGGIDCNSYGDLKTDLQNFFNLIKIAVPLLVIGLSTYDFIKAITQKDEKNVKKAFITLGKRMIYAIILFFLPAILNLLLDLFGTNSSVCVE